MNKKQKSLTNKGFSLVELIIVIAIMAVLIGVLAPQYLKYVESSRLQKDNQAISEIANAVKIAMADETINSSTTSPFTITPSSGTYTFSASSTDALVKELSTVVGENVKLTSNTYTATAPTITATAPTITVTKETSGVVKVTAVGYVSKIGATASTSANPQVF